MKKPGASPTRRLKRHSRVSKRVEVLLTGSEGPMGETEEDKLLAAIAAAVARTAELRASKGLLGPSLALDPDPEVVLLLDEECRQVLDVAEAAKGPLFREGHSLLRDAFFGSGGSPRLYDR
jgi:hypothetical protein